MLIALVQLGHGFRFDQLQQVVLAGGAMSRLLVASLLGAAIGFDREFRHKPSGLRTNLLICFGCALFTFLSVVLAGESNPDKGRVASNIVQGIGFLGAGLILHNRNRISGMTSAATVFVVASIGMACGAGLYLPAILATAVVLIALESVGLLEGRFNLKVYPLIYEARGKDNTRMMGEILEAMDSENRRLFDVQQDNFDQVHRISFPVVATSKQHLGLQQSLRAKKSIDEVLTFRDPEEE
ncbi:MAG TPA: MgtC/SapB family protein [Acidisarcina sp.]|nr:MgtC/SapB family protein [Acidisarcina sp.]